MIQILVVHRISNDYNSWKKEFDTTISRAQKAGCQGYSTGTQQNDSKSVYVFASWDNVNNFNKFFQSKETMEAMKKSGVVGEPQVTIFNQIDQRWFAMETAQQH